jgi:hypothetical protein
VRGCLRLFQIQIEPFLPLAIEGARVRVQRSESTGSMLLVMPRVAVLVAERERSSTLGRTRADLADFDLAAARFLRVSR